MELHTMQEQSTFFRTLEYNYYLALNLLRTNGWSLLGVAIIALGLYNWLEPRARAFLRARRDAAHHKDPDTVLSRERALWLAREALQRQQLEASRRAAALQAERRETKRREAAELLARNTTGSRLGSDDGYLPLSGGGGAGSTYRAPKRSACGGGGCGR